MFFKKGNLEKQVLEIPKEVKWCKKGWCFHLQVEL